MAKKSEITFQEAMDELKEILSRIESEELQIDAIPTLINRSKELQNICHDKLLHIQQVIDVEKQ